MPEVDDDQLAALRRLRAAFGPVEVVGHDPAAGRTSRARGEGMADPGRMPRRSESKPMAHRFLEAEARLAKREPGRNA